ncbi:MAG: hypothetical protein ACH350_07980 [Parachlamydiaceae bacterium]
MSTTLSTGHSLQAFSLLNYCISKACDQAMPMQEQKRIKQEFFNNVSHLSDEQKEEAFQTRAEKVIKTFEEIFQTFQQQAEIDHSLSVSSSENKRQLQERKIELQRNIQSQRTLFADEYGYDPDIAASCFTLIRQEAEKIFQSTHGHTAQEEKMAFLQRFRHPQDDLNLSEIDRLIQTCQKEQTAIDHIQKQFQQLLAFSKREDQSEYQLTIQHTGDTPFCATISTQNVLMGYSIFILCQSLQIAHMSVYSGEQAFPLQLDDLVTIEEHLNWMSEKIADFSALLQTLIGGQENQYIELGQKKLTASIRDQESLNSTITENFYAQLPHDPTALSPLGLSLFQEVVEKNHDAYFLLFSQISLNLTTHPLKDFYKHLFEQWYANEGMLARNGKLKTFQIDDPYRSALDGGQIMRIAPSIQAYLKMRKLFPLDNHMNQKPDILIKQLLEVQIKEMMQKMPIVCLDWDRLSNQASTYLRDKERQLEKSRIISYVDLYKESVFMLFIFKYLMADFPKQAHLFSPSQGEIDALYQGEIFTTYSPGFRHKNVHNLFDSLTSSLGIQNAEESQGEYSHRFSPYSTVLTTLEKELVRRLEEYPTLSYDGCFGKIQIDNAVASFEQYVALIVYRERSLISEESIETSLNVALDRAGSDMISGCGQGLAGRFLDLLSILSENTRTDLSSTLQQFKANCLQESFDALYSLSSESSMKVTHKEWVARMLHIRPGDPSECEIDHLLLTQIMKKCNAVTIAAESIRFFCSAFSSAREDREDEKIYHLFAELGFGNDREQLDRDYKKQRGDVFKWDYDHFKDDLPFYLIPYLIRNGHLSLKEGDSQNHVKDCLVTANKQVRIEDVLNVDLGILNSKEELMNEVNHDWNLSTHHKETFSGWIE